MRHRWVPCLSIILSHCFAGSRGVEEYCRGDDNLGLMIEIFTKVFACHLTRVVVMEI
jgi:hypothetical protein